MEFDDVARRIDDTGTQLSAAGARIASVQLIAAGFGSAGPGGLGELGRSLHDQAAVALAARAGEARSLGAAATALASSVARALAGYQETESRRGGPDGSA